MVQWNLCKSIAGNYQTMKGSQTWCEIYCQISLKFLIFCNVYKMITLTLKWIVTIFKYCFPSEWIWYNFKWSVDIFVWFDNFCLALCYWHVTLCTITLQRTPHTLVWAKLKGYPFWPAKVSLLYFQHLCLTG